MSDKINEQDFREFDKTEKLGIVATIDDVGDPHITLLTTLMAADEKTMVVGQFSQGLSKKNMLERSKSGFAVMTLDMEFWTGTVDWKYSKTEGPEYVKYNNMQMWRFNTYFGINTVYYGDLVEISERRKLNLLGVGVNALKVKARKAKYKTGKSEVVMRPIGERLFNGLVNPKFISFVDEKGYPVVVPLVQSQASGSDRIVFTAKPYADMLAGLKKGARAAVLCVSMQMESVLVKGVFGGFENGLGYIDVDRVYNGMPPIAKYVYPYEETKPVENF